MYEKTLTQLAAALKSGEFSSRELTAHYLQRIEKADGKLNSFISVTAEQALKHAEIADNARAAGTAGPLVGIPLALKDIFCTRDVKTSCGSKMLDSFIAPYNATRHGHRYRRLHPPTGGVLRHHWFEAHLWPCISLWHYCLRFKS